jgi:anti-sigma B factor antagonist
MSDTPTAAAIAMEKDAGALVARLQMKLMDDNALEALARLVDEDAGGDSPSPLVILDLSRVAFLPSLALGLLVQLGTKCAARQQKLTLTGVRPQVRQVFSITRLDRVFQFADTVEAARA